MTHEQALELAAAYVLGALEASEEAAVREHLASCELPHPEFAELGGVVPLLAETVELVEPPTSLRARIMEAAARDLADLQAQGAPAVQPEPAVEQRRPTAERTRTQPTSLDAERAARRPARFAWALGLAAVIAIAALGAWNVTLRSDLDAAQAYRTNVEQTLAKAAQAGSTTAILTSEVQPNASGLAVVGADGSVSVIMRGLAPTSGTKVYEAWVIVGTSAPKPIGSFTVAANGTGFLATAASAAPAPTGVTVALTLEDAPGATAPKPPIITAGEAS